MTHMHARAGLSSSAASPLHDCRDSDSRKYFDRRRSRSVPAVTFKTKSLRNCTREGGSEVREGGSEVREGGREGVSHDDDDLSALVPIKTVITKENDEPTQERGREDQWRFAEDLQGFACFVD